MNQSKTLIVDDNQPTIAIIVATLQDAQLPYVIVDSNEDALKHVAADVGISWFVPRSYRVVGWMPQRRSHRRDSH